MTAVGRKRTILSNTAETGFVPIAEIVGALAVFLTVFYLAIQIRQNTKSNEPSAVVITLAHLAIQIRQNSGVTRAARLFLAAEIHSR